jgi:hypothetical protein
VASTSQGEWIIAGFEIAVCADESGIHNTAKVCILAGYIGSVRQWEQFDRNWSETLDKYDVADFHSRDFFAYDKKAKRAGSYRMRSDPSQKCSYYNWPDDKYANLLHELVNVIHNTNIVPLGAAVDVPAFFALTYGERKFLTGGLFDGKKWLNSGAPSKPYFNLFEHCLVDAALKTKSKKQVAFIFDKQKEYESRAITAFKEVMHTADLDIRKKLFGAVYLPRIEAPGLQAADLYTHCWYRYLTDPLNVGGLRNDVLDVLTIKNAGMLIYNAAHFETMMNKLPANIRDALRNTVDPTSRH